MARQLERFDNLVSMFLTRAEEKGDEPFLWAKRSGEWRPISWAETAGARASTPIVWVSSTSPASRISWRDVASFSAAMFNNV